MFFSSVPLKTINVLLFMFMKQVLENLRFMSYAVSTAVSALVASINLQEGLAGNECIRGRLFRAQNEQQHNLHFKDTQESA